MITVHAVIDEFHNLPARHTSEFMGARKTRQKHRTEESFVNIYNVVMQQTAMIKLPYATESVSKQRRKSGQSVSFEQDNPVNRPIGSLYNSIPS